MINILLTDFTFLNPLIEAINVAFVPVISALAAFGCIYSVFLGFNLAKAENSEKRLQAKKRIINAVLTIIITIVIVVLLKLVLNNLNVWFGEGTELSGDSSTVAGVIKLLFIK